MARGQFSLFAEGDRLEMLSEMGDPLVRLDGAVGWEAFRPVPGAALSKERRGPGGRPPYDYVVMPKALAPRQLHSIPGGACELTASDRLSFRRFLGLGLSDRVPDAKTIRRFRERLTEAGAVDALFSQFTAMLEGRGLVTRRGSLVDATFVVPRARGTPAGRTPRQRRGGPPSPSRTAGTGSGRRTQTPAGRRRAARRTTDTRATSTWTGTPS